VARKAGGLPSMRVSAATLLVGALLLAGCGGSTTTHARAPQSGTTAKHVQQSAAGVLDSLSIMRAYARYVVCMHVHGVAYVAPRRSSLRLLKALFARSAPYRAANLACYTTLAAGNRAVAGRIPSVGSG
jgi:hypothetical protein